MTPANLRTLISCIDLTRLNAQDTPAHIDQLCQEAKTHGVAAVCVLPHFVSQAWQNLMETPVKVATVVNFPAGDEPPEEVTQTIQQAILDGAAEIDAVIPKINTAAFVTHCKKLCGSKALLKVILETGHLSADEIATLSDIAIDNGADFLKTSTGKIPIGATPEAAKIMLAAIKKSNKTIGFKASGGIQTFAQAEIYINLTQDILGSQAFHPDRFRIGASQLLQDILCALPTLN